MSLSDKFTLANDLLRWARTLAARSHATMTMGVTIIVHNGTLRPGQMEVAITTTLPSRAAQRLILAEALARTLMSDGVANDDISEVAARDLAAFERGDLKP